MRIGLGEMSDFRPFVGVDGLSSYSQLTNGVLVDSRLLLPYHTAAPLALFVVGIPTTRVGLQ